MKSKLFFLSLIFSTTSFAQKKQQDTVANAITKTISGINQTDSVKTKAENIYIKVEGEEKSFWADWLPILVTLLVAYAAYRGVIKQSKASSVSGFRVKWIEDLRVSYAEFLIALRNVDNKIRLGTLDLSQYQRDEDIDKVQFLKTKIKLLLNHNETSDKEHVDFWKALLQYMDDHRTYYKGAFSELTENELDQKRVVMERLLLSIFKREWDKAKNLG